MSAGKTGRKGGKAACEEEIEVASTEKKEVICRCEGSLAAPANCRFVRGADMLGWLTWIFFLFEKWSNCCMAPSVIGSLLLAGRLTRTS